MAYQVRYERLLEVLKILSLLLLVTVAAQADPYFYNASPEKIKVKATLPNGNVDDRGLSASSVDFPSAYFTLHYAIAEIKVSIEDEGGKVLWSGPAKKNQAFLILPPSSSNRVVPCGYVGSNKQPSAAVFMSLLPEDAAVDLVGHNGIGAVRGAALPKAFDTKNLVALCDKEASWNVLVKQADGTTVKAENVINPGRYVVVWRDQWGKNRTASLGTIKP